MTVFPDILLPEVLDYFDLHELLFSAMPVNRFWRSSVIEHPCYWKLISLDEESTHARGVHSPNLFFLRLARAGTKPVDLRIWMEDPAAVLDTLAREVYHIRRLTMCIRGTHSGSLFLNMRDTPAPILEKLSLTLNDEPSSQGPSMVPEVLFAEDVPVLTDVALTNVAFPSGGELPAWLAHANITTFIYGFSPFLTQIQHLPNIFPSWPRLRNLILGGMISLADPAFLHASTWAGLELLSLDYGLVQSIPALPLAQISHIRISNTALTADEMVFIANCFMHSGPLDVTLSTEQHLPGIRRAYSVELRGHPHTRMRRWRFIRGHLPPVAPGTYPDDMIAAFQHGPLVPRIVSLRIWLDSWDVLIGQGYLAHFPAVEDLALTLYEWNETWPAPPRAAKLELPRLRRIMFQYAHDDTAYRKPVLQLADLADFATNQLSGVPLPVHLALEDVEAEGLPEDFAEVFQI